MVFEELPQCAKKHPKLSELQVIVFFGSSCLKKNNRGRRKKGRRKEERRRMKGVRVAKVKETRANERFTWRRMRWKRDGSELDSNSSLWYPVYSNQ